MAIQEIKDLEARVAALEARLDSMEAPATPKSDKAVRVSSRGEKETA